MNTPEDKHIVQFRQAIAYCLAYELRHKRLDPVELSQQAKTYERPAAEPDELAGRVLYYADFAATEFPDYDKKKVDLAQHPLHGAWHKLGFQDQAVIALVYGGATKIKGYVFESARLPEVRGASALLDRINTIDIRALWGWIPKNSDGELERVKKIHKRYGCLESPECIVYAGGGNFLAFAPVSMAQKMADQVEHIYTTETLVANSAVVADSFSLLELLYGRQPERYWLEDLQSQRNDPNLRTLLESYYGGTSNDDFLAKKRFAELVTVLAGKMMRRRGEWGDQDGQQRRHIPHYELFPYAVKCHSCDVRPAIVRDPAADKEYCEPCARKRVAGQAAKKETGRARGWFYNDLNWRPTGVGSWEVKFDRFLSESSHASQQQNYYQDLMAASQGHLDRIERLSDEERKTIQKLLDEQKLKDMVAYVQAHPTHPDELPLLVPANDLHEIGRASSPNRYVGLIYADGNDIGARIASMTSAAKYSQFSEDLFNAAQEAVFEALADHLAPIWIEEAVDPERPDRRQIWAHPWEIITIGGDDLIIIVPGSKALDIAVSIGQKLELELGQPGSTPCYADQRYQAYSVEESEDEGPARIVADAKALDYVPDISLSAGVVVAHETTPIFFLHELAEQLQNSAKSWRKDTGYPAGTVDFIVLKSMGMVASRLQEFRERAYQVDDRWLTARPYTWIELSGLLKAARAVNESGLGRSQVYRLQDFLMQGQESAAINYLYAFTRLGPEERQKLACAFHLAWHKPGDVPPWRHRPDGKVETIWRDLVEIYDFVREEA
jgi:CRISPR-associated protein Cmr2